MNLLAFDTGTETMSIAVTRTVQGQLHTWQHSALGGAQASTGLIPAILQLLRQADLRLEALQAICFGAGPGSFTGLRTACAVAQGMAFGANVPVLAMDSLWVVAEEARFSALAAHPCGVITALLDARMNEMYAASYAFAGAQWTQLQASCLLRPEDLGVQLQALQPVAATLHHAAGVPASHHLAGNVLAVYGERLVQVGDSAALANFISAAPSATAMLRLAPQMLAAGRAVDAQHALPIYIRDKVAQTTLERTADKTAELSANAKFT